MGSRGSPDFFCILLKLVWSYIYGKMDFISFSLKDNSSEKIDHFPFFIQNVKLILFDLAHFLIGPVDFFKYIIL